MDISVSLLLFCLHLCLLFPAEFTVDMWITQKHILWPHRLPRVPEHTLQRAKHTPKHTDARHQLPPRNASFTDGVRKFGASIVTPWWNFQPPPPHPLPTSHLSLHPLQSQASFSHPTPPLFQLISVPFLSSLSPTCSRFFFSLLIDGPRCSPTPNLCRQYNSRTCLLSFACPSLSPAAFSSSYLFFTLFALRPDNSISSLPPMLPVPFSQFLFQHSAVIEAWLSRGANVGNC